MANYTGAIRFPDGALRYFVFAGTTETVMPRLFTTETDADDAWNNPQSDTPRHQSMAGDEPVEVMPYYCHGSRAVAFMSTANRESCLITGVLSVQEAEIENEQLDRWL